jgi:dTDP-4-dehydrorhamnose reductase
MLGSAVYRFFQGSPGYDVYGTVRSAGHAAQLPQSVSAHIMPGVDVENHDNLVALFGRVKPDYIVNCIGLVKQLAAADDVLTAVPINSVLPHRLAALSELVGARLVHMSTDCVFSGSRGMYLEADAADAGDVYGRSKLLGELHYPHTVTLRTSIIGHELNGARSLVNWFLSQEGKVSGYTKAIFSGLPTVEIARVIRDYVLPNPDLRGLFHVSADPISKFDLLRLISAAYGKAIEIQPDERVAIDRSLDSTAFKRATGFRPEPWPELVRRMHQFS